MKLRLYSITFRYTNTFESSIQSTDYSQCSQFVSKLPPGRKTILLRRAGEKFNRIAILNNIDFNMYDIIASPV